MKWSELQPEQLRAELAKHGLQPIHLVLDLHDVDDPYVQAKINAAAGDPVKLLKIAVVWFGDEGHKQPKPGRIWTNEEVRRVLWGAPTGLFEALGMPPIEGSTR